MLNIIYCAGGAVIIMYASYIVVKETIRTKNQVKGFIRNKKENKGDK